MNLDSVGYQHYITKLKTTGVPPLIGRVTTEHKTGWDLYTKNGKVPAIALTTWRKKLQVDQLPKVGDFVIYEELPGERKVKITSVLPRFSSLSRILTEQKTTQVLAANIDTAFIVVSLDQEINFNQLNRYLLAAKSGKTKVVVIINKTDKSSGAKKLTDQIIEYHPTLKIISTSAKNKTGLEKLEKEIKPQHTIVFIGNSGAGKSSLINLLLDFETQSTGNVREDGKGRHTTTRREMFVLPKGGIVIDTPGIRTVEFTASDDDTNNIFPELLAITTKCKFRNCDHRKSSGCALQTAIDTGKVSKEQVNQFLRLTQNDSGDKGQREVSQERKQKHKMIHKALKKHLANKK